MLRTRGSTSALGGMKSEYCWILARALAVASFLAAAISHGVYTFYVQHGVQLLGNALQVLTLLAALTLFAAPLLAAIGLFRGKIWGFYALGVFPVAAFTFGVSAIPLIGQLFPVGAPRSIAVGLINGAFLVSAVWLWHGAKHAAQQSTAADPASLGG